MGITFTPYDPPPRIYDEWHEHPLGRWASDVDELLYEFHGASVFWCASRRWTLERVRV